MNDENEILLSEHFPTQCSQKVIVGSVLAVYVTGVAAVPSAIKLINKN